VSWLYSRALVGGSSPPSYLVGEPFAQWSTVHTHDAFLSHGKTMEALSLSQSGTTCGLLTDRLGGALLRLCLAAFPARPTAAHLEDELWRTISGRKCDGSWQMSLPGTYSPRTPSEGRSKRLPTTSSRWVTKSDAFPFPRQTWVRTTFGNDIGFVHTPTATANYSAPSMQKHPNCRAFVKVFGKPTPMNQEWLMGWPIGWTDLKPLETDKFLASRRRRGELSVEVSA
jgi:hypothetical protein